MKKLYQDITKSKLIRKKSRKNRTRNNRSGNNKSRKNRTRKNRSRKNRTRNTKSKKNHKSIKNNKNKTKQFKNKKRGGGPVPLVANNALYKIPNDEHNIYVKVTDGTNYTTFPGNGIIIPSYSEYRALGNKPINLGTIGLSGCTVIAIEIHYEDKILLWISHILSSINKDTVNNILDKILEKINDSFDENINWTMFNQSESETDNFKITLYAQNPNRSTGEASFTNALGKPSKIACDVLIKQELDEKIGKDNTKIKKGNKFRFEVKYITLYVHPQSSRSPIKLQIKRLVSWDVGVWNYGTPNNTDE
tara:strand:- start:673 stop:1590 length:918 start_codon:yes stop_codon:yes gene_type:complete